MVNLQPDENRLVALSTICTHLGCIPAWLEGDQKYKCPCHGSGYYITWREFRRPDASPLERFAITKTPTDSSSSTRQKFSARSLANGMTPQSFVMLA
jgi:cytochrome b6-f complex iron-sulfur subunit